MIHPERKGWTLHDERTRPFARPGSGALPVVGGSVLGADALLLVTKLTPPALHDGRLPRSRLVRRLQTASDVPLVRIVAPTGFGKTSLVHEWAVADVRRAFCWLSLDRTDDQPARLWGYITESLCRGEPRVRGVLSELLPQGHSRYVEDRLIPALVAAISAVGRPIALVLDDAHLLRSPQTLEQLDFLLARAPRELQTVLIGREGSRPSRLGLMRVRGQTLELDADDLRFDATETRDFLIHHLALDLDARQVDELAALTEGWPAALRLAGMRLRGGRTPEETLAALRATRGDVAEYLRAEMLDAIPRNVRALLSRAAMLREISPPLLDAVSDATGSAAVLEGLGDLAPFVPPLRDRPGWYRMHSLLGEVLRRELIARGDDDVRVLHERASAWHEQHGSSVRAIEHAIAAGDARRAALLLRRAWGPFTWRDHDQLLRWIDAIPPETSQSDPVLALAAAWAMGAANRTADMERWLAHAQGAPGFDATVVDGVGAGTLADLGRAVFSRDDVGGRARAARAVAAAHPEGSPLEVLAKTALGVARYHAGRVGRARRDLEQALPRIGSDWAVAIAPAAQAYLALCLLEEGEIEEAAEMARLARRRAIEQPLTHPDLAGLGLLASGAVMHARGDHAGARAALQDASEELARAGSSLPGAEALLRLAAAAEAAGDRPAAQVATSGALALVARCPDPGALGPAAARAAERLGVAAHDDGGGPPDEQLSTREVQILTLLASGLSRREIATELYVSFNTVATHARSIYRKLGVGSREEAVARGRARGLIEVPGAGEPAGGGG